MAISTIGTNGLNQSDTDLGLSGNVGIGTASPANKVVISTSGNSNHLSLIGAQQNAMQFQSATGGAGFIVGRSLSSDNANDFFIYDLVNSATRFRILNNGDLQFNSGYGTQATAYGCRAWVNFNGTGTVAIRASGNVTSITDNGVGDYTVNFTNAMPDANYTSNFQANQGTPSSAGNFVYVGIGYSKTTSAYRFNPSSNGASYLDISEISVVFFR